VRLYSWAVLVAVALGGVGCHRPAAVTLPQPPPAVEEFACPVFKFRHPPGWTLDTADADYKPGHNLTFNCGAAAFVKFIVVDEGEVSDQELRGQMDFRRTNHRRNFNPVREETALTTWGAHDGRGVSLRGRSFNTDVCTRLFTFHAGGRTVHVTEFHTDSRRAELSPGFRMIEQTFELVR
jgi:hypothetical protein